MIYEPGTADIFTSGNALLPGGYDDTEDEVLAGLMRRILDNPAGFKVGYRGGAFGERRRLMMTTVARTLELTPHEYDVVVTAAPDRRGYWFEDLR